MCTIGIVAEFDPFHRGHAYLVQEARRLCGEESTVVAAMSGDFTQRGGCASFDRHTRAELALRGGVDLVVELPLPWAISSAEAFALGGIRALLAAGVDTLAFGSECGEAARLERVAKALESAEYPQKLRTALTSGCSFAAARQKALTELVGEDAAVLEHPNDLLGVSYLAAARKLGANLKAVAIGRKGAAHNAAQVEDGIASASAIRSLLLRGETETAFALLPESSGDLLRREMAAGNGPADLKWNERAVLTRLRLMTPEDFLCLPDCSEGLENRLYRAAQQACSLEEFYALARSKRYPHARIRRLALWAYLGLEASDRPDSLPYLRVLGMNEKGQALLHREKKRCPVEVLTKPAAVKKLDNAARRLFALEVRAADLRRLCLPELAASQGGQEWRSGPVRIKPDFGS